MLDYITHDAEAFSVVSRFVETSSGVEKSVGAFLVVLVGFNGSGFVMKARLVEVLDLLEEVIGKTKVGFETDLAARVALDDRFPNFESLFVFSDLQSGIAGL